ncbi:flagellar hook-associated protein FlgK [Bosea rubneri]|uniref:Flagellar hook-associated protein 1 n=1 Tax=Bosea rubneri TaxID=3075434 RepID=A0ABU3S4K3_9HYPH|nr:flagellar hook-associated protein FlgK [Bosea sp. ZW T0_25]MDU0339666.1 flagellar hook-associated protein FlgK [Bosea sp. ZW T0_25]
MGLGTALDTAISGLRGTQAGIGVISQNVANVGTAGYVRRSVSNVDTNAGRNVGVGNPNVQRLLDRIVQHQLWQETSGAAYTATRAEAFAGLDQLYGAPGSATALDSMFSTFTSSLQALRNDPSSYTNRTAVLNSASQLANRLRTVSEGVQTLRNQAEAGIGNAVGRVNELLDSLTNVNARIVNGEASSGNADLRDQRERIVSELSQYLEIRTQEQPSGAITITAASGTQLFDGRPTVRFEFDQRSALGPNAQWSTDPAQRGVGTIVARDLSGNGFDAIANNTFRSGEIGALLELRDKTLVQAQAQLDEIAAQLASALSDREVAGTAATAGAATGFDVDLNGLKAGNTVTLDYKVTPGRQTQRYTFVRVDSAASLPLPASAQGDANNRVIGIDFSGGPASVAAQMQAAVGPGFTISNTGSVLRIVDDGAAGTRDVVGLIARPTQDSLTGGTAELPFFVDSGRANGAYTGSYEGGAQSVGFASRIVVNPNLVSDPKSLVLLTPTTPQGDTTRPQFLLDRLTSSQRSFTNATGFDGSGATSSMTMANFVQRVVAGQGQASAAAQRLDEGQQVALAAVQSRFLEDAQVNVDQEMSTLIELQSAYAANARVISTVKELLDVLLRL